MLRERVITLHIYCLVGVMVKMASVVPTVVTTSRCHLRKWLVVLLFSPCTEVLLTHSLACTKYTTESLKRSIYESVWEHNTTRNGGAPLTLASEHGGPLGRRIMPSPRRVNRVTWP